MNTHIHIIKRMTKIITRTHTHRVRGLTNYCTHIKHEKKNINIIILFFINTNSTDTHTHTHRQDFWYWGQRGENEQKKKITHNTNNSQSNTRKYTNLCRPIHTTQTQITRTNMHQEQPKMYTNTQTHTHTRVYEHISNKCTHYPSRVYNRHTQCLWIIFIRMVLEDRKWLGWGESHRAWHPGISLVLKCGSFVTEEPVQRKKRT